MLSAKTRGLSSSRDPILQFHKPIYNHYFSKTFSLAWSSTEGQSTITKEIFAVWRNSLYVQSAQRSMWKQTDVSGFTPTALLVSPALAIVQSILPKYSLNCYMR